jgi:hypothetical protein
MHRTPLGRRETPPTHDALELRLRDGLVKGEHLRTQLGSSRKPLLPCGIENVRRAKAKSLDVCVQTVSVFGDSHLGQRCQGGRLPLLPARRFVRYFGRREEVVQ